MIISRFQQFNDKRGIVLNVLREHLAFLQKNTGTTYDAQKEHYVFNEDMVLSNNRHFIAASRQEAQPNGDATTEGQSLQIIGPALVYLATRDKAWLTMAEQCFEAYCKFFYREDKNPMPTPPAPWYCNWIINGKEPVFADYPYDSAIPTHSGFRGVTFSFVDGVANIPHGAPHWGEYLDLATFAFVGALGWDSINASVKFVKDDGEIDWDREGTQYDVDWIINWEGKKIDWDGNAEEFSDGTPVIYPDDMKGTVKLKEAITGDFKFNYAVRLPEEHGGVVIHRNEPQHNRPCHVPVTVPNQGNAADAEEWFADAAFLLWKITGKKRYYNAWQCSLETCGLYADIDSYDRFFRRSTAANTPWTDGIAYDWTYPSDQEVIYDRDINGYITATVPSGAKLSMEQQAVWFTVDKDSRLVCEFGGKGDTGKPITATVHLELGEERGVQKNTGYQFALGSSSSDLVTKTDIRIGDMCESVNSETGDSFFVADPRNGVSWGKDVCKYNITNNTIDGRTAGVWDVDFGQPSGGDGGFKVGAWLLKDGVCLPNKITYRSDGPVFLHRAGKFTFRGQGVFGDMTLSYNGTVIVLRSTGMQWKTVDFSELPPQDFVARLLSVEEVIRADYEPQSDFLFFTESEYVAAKERVRFSFYCFDDVPKLYDGTESTTHYFRIDIAGEEGYTAKIGDCTIKDYKLGAVAYTPGVIPFSNNPLPDSPTFDAWRGLPYPGYQYPFIYTHDEARPGRWDEKLRNMCHFMLDSQKWYQKKFGVLGPGASAYVWDRWDCLKYGEPDTFTMYHWGDDEAWAGYQPRAFCGMTRAWYELVIQGKDVPQDMVEYSENWIHWLADFARASKITPTAFPMEEAAKPVYDDFTGHMCGLWLAGACYAYLAGCKLYDEIDIIVETAVNELFNNLVLETPDEIMNGSWSPAIRSWSGKGAASNGMFFGFWSGEILRGLALYLMYKSLPVGADMYKV